MTEPIAGRNADFDAWRRRRRRHDDGDARVERRASAKHYAQINAGILDKEAREQFTFPAQYMFKDVPDYGERRRPGRAPARGDGPLQHHPRHDATSRRTRWRKQAVREHPDRFVGSFNVDPNHGHGGVRELDAARARARRPLGAGASPPGCCPQVPINDKKMYPLYAKCVELDIPIFVNAGVPGPAGPDGVPGRRADRRGVLVLPRAQARDAPRRRAVDRARR